MAKKKTLIIAEKPSVARDIAEVLGAKASRSGYIEGDDHVVSWCIGHLVGLAKPKSYDERWASWSLDHLPMLPERCALEVRDPNGDMYPTLERLLLDPGFERVVNACDAGREGELIFGLVYELSGSRLPVDRLWISSMTSEAISEGLKNMRPGTDYTGLGEAARARSQADWIMGINATRCVTSCVRKTSPHVRGVVSVGRVQTPTLAMLVKRWHERESFVSTNFFTLIGSFSASSVTYKGVWVGPLDSSSETWPTAPRKLDDSKAARALATKLSKVDPVVAARVETKEGTKAPPRLYDLTSLQRDANTRLDLSAARTLEIAQALYEKHKLLTYPRTDSRCISSDMTSTMTARVDAIAAWDELSDLARKLVWDPENISKRVVDDSRVSDHHAIVPTSRSYSGQGLSNEERDVYELVCRRTLAALAPPARTSRTRAWTVVAGEDAFLTQGTQILEQGWMSFEREPPTLKEGREEDVVSGLVPTELVSGLPIEKASISSKNGRTSAPAAFNEATLLSAMEHAGRRLDDDELADAISDGGLGTPATRAGVIEGLLHREFIVREGKKLIPTPRGVELIDALSHFPALTSPELTATWERALGHIESGQLTRTSFIKQVGEFTSALVEHFGRFPPTIKPPEKPSVGECPSCGSPLHLHPDGLYCSKLPAKECTLWVGRKVASKNLTDRQLITLATRGKTPTLKGFKKRAGGTFAAMLELVQDKAAWKVRFAFDGPRDAPHVVRDTPCPSCGGELQADKRKVWCPGEGCSFSLWHSIAGRTLADPELQALIAKGRTSTLDGFTSKKTGKSFSAALELEHKGGAWRANFSFEDNGRKS